VATLGRRRSARATLPGAGQLAGRG